MNYEEWRERENGLRGHGLLDFENIRVLGLVLTVMGARDRSSPVSPRRSRGCGGISSELCTGELLLLCGLGLGLDRRVLNGGGRHGGLVGEGLRGDQRRFGRVLGSRQGSEGSVMAELATRGVLQVRKESFGSSKASQGFGQVIQSGIGKLGGRSWRSWKKGFVGGKENNRRCPACGGGMQLLLRMCLLDKLAELEAAPWPPRPGLAYCILHTVDPHRALSLPNRTSCGDDTWQSLHALPVGQSPRSHPIVWDIGAL